MTKLQACGLLGCHKLSIFLTLAVSLCPGVGSVNSKTQSSKSVPQIYLYHYQLLYSAVSPYLLLNLLVRVLKGFFYLFTWTISLCFEHGLIYPCHLMACCVLNFSLFVLGSGHWKVLSRNCSTTHSFSTCDQSSGGIYMECSFSLKSKTHSQSLWWKQTRIYPLKILKLVHSDN